MNLLSRVTGTVLVIAGATLLISHGARALHATRPSDMPSDARFVQTGYDLRHNEPRGNWIACGTDTERGADFCRVTDAKGSVIYQGDFLPEGDINPLPATELHVAAVDQDQLWLERPSDTTPFPAIPLADGKVLIPVAEAFTSDAERASYTASELHRLGIE